MKHTRPVFAMIISEMWALVCKESLKTPKR